MNMAGGWVMIPSSDDDDPSVALGKIGEPLRLSGSGTHQLL